MFKPLGTSCRGLLPLLIVPTFLLSATVVAETLTIGGTGGDLGTMKQLGARFEDLHSGVSVKVLPSLGSSGGIKAVTAGATDLSVSSRPLKEKEKKPGVVAVPYANTAIVVVTMDNHGLPNVTRSELAGIYSGIRTKWPDGTSIRLILRPEYDTDTKTIKTQIPELRKALITAGRRRGVPVGITAQKAADLIEKLPGALGLLSLSLVLGENRAMKSIPFDGVVPTAESIASGRYPILKTFYLVTGPKSGALAREFIDFIRSPEGSSILARTGHVGIDLGATN